ncbi:biopolymer transporter ExbD [Tautonia sociabilis]|uniref:Biopolymer transporter ExbD n=1 Tax=Tautonia sociabilis TaxID=2080755 RepID=A0A432MGE7_9BACT|nr:biopolymer transporter ExbD [Tautonia sociabilis]RUL85600.1 biopolymer transporter ExbD [Tautonia sociabilis]
MPRPIPAALALLAAIAPIALADDFDRLEGRVLEEIPGGPIATAHPQLTVAELAGLPNVLGRIRSAVLVVRTDQGNPARVLISPGFRPAPVPEGADPEDRPKPAPILILERFATFEAAGGAAPDRIAAGRDVFLFDGFRFDLDSGQVVPEGQGGDLRFVASGEGEPLLEAIGGATLYTLDQAPEFPDAEPGSPSPGRVILPGDYAGRFRLFADGSLSGTLTLAVEGRTVSGSFRSDQTGSAYEVRGEVVAGPDPIVRFSVQFPRARQEYEGLLFSEGKGAMAGTVLLLDRDRPFFAIRDGGDLSSAGGAGPAAP